MWSKIVMCAQKHWWAGVFVLAALLILDKAC
jgi:hypothetical protein